MTLGLYQTVTEGLTFIAEFTSNQGKSHADATIKNSSFAKVGYALVIPQNSTISTPNLMYEFKCR